MKPVATLLAAAALSFSALAHGGWKVAPSKPHGSGVRLQYEVPSRLQAGQAAVVRLRFDHVRGNGARVELKAPPQVTVTTADGRPVSDITLQRGQPTTLVLHVTPSTDGVHYIDVFTSQDGQGSAQSVALRVGTGTPQLKRDGAPQATPSGEQVISLPSSR